MLKKILFLVILAISLFFFQCTNDKIETLELLKEDCPFKYLPNEILTKVEERIFLSASGEIKGKFSAFRKKLLLGEITPKLLGDIKEINTYSTLQKIHIDSVFAHVYNVKVNIICTKWKIAQNTNAQLVQEEISKGIESLESLLIEYSRKDNRNKYHLINSIEKFTGEISEYIMKLSALQDGNPITKNFKNKLKFLMISISEIDKENISTVDISGLVDVIDSWDSLKPKISRYLK